MSTSTLNVPTPRLAASDVLVSDIPAVAGTVATRPSLLARVRDSLVDRHQSRSFERALRSIDSASETNDLHALHRRG